MRLGCLRYTDMQPSWILPLNGVLSGMCVLPHWIYSGICSTSDLNCGTCSTCPILIWRRCLAMSSLWLVMTPSYLSSSTLLFILSKNIFRESSTCKSMTSSCRPILSFILSKSTISAIPARWLGRTRGVTFLKPCCRSSNSYIMKLQYIANDGVVNSCFDAFLGVECVKLGDSCRRLECYCGVAIIVCNVGYGAWIANLCLGDILFGKLFVYLFIFD